MSFNNIKLKPKLVSLFLLVGIVPVVIVGWTASNAAYDSLMKKSFQKLNYVRDVKKVQVERYFNRIASQIITFSESHMIIDAMKGFKEAFGNFRKENNISDNDLARLRSELETYYSGEFAGEYKKQNNKNIDALKLLSRVD